MKIRELFIAIALVAMTGAAQADEIDNRLENMGLEQLPSGFEAGEQLVGEVNNTLPAAAKFRMPEKPSENPCGPGDAPAKNGVCVCVENCAPNLEISGGGGGSGSKSPKKDEGGEPLWKDYTKTNKPNKTKK